MDEDYRALIESNFSTSSSSAQQQAAQAQQHNDASDQNLEDVDVDEASAQALRDEFFRDIKDVHGEGDDGVGHGDDQAQAHSHDHDQDVSMDDQTGLMGDDVDVDVGGPSLSNHQVASGSDTNDRKGKRRKNGSGGGRASSGGGLTEEEKKARQRAQNRKAAEKSRSKKRNEFNALEVVVNNIQEENARLRVRLAALQAARNPEATGESSTTPTQHNIPATSSTLPTLDPSLDNLSTLDAASTSGLHPTKDSQHGPQVGTEIDYKYLDKIQSELKSVRANLSEKETQLQRLQGGEEMTARVAILRQLLLDQHGNLKTLQAEASSLESLVASLDLEKEEIDRQLGIVQRELALRGIGSGIIVDSEGTASGSKHQVGGPTTMEEGGDGATEGSGPTGQNKVVGVGVGNMGSGSGSGSGIEEAGAQVAAGTDIRSGVGGVDKALADIRGWVDAAVRDWAQAGSNPITTDGSGIGTGPNGNQ